MNFLNLLIENHRMPVIYRVRREYERLWEQENRVLPVELTSAIELDEATMQSIGREHRREHLAQGDVEHPGGPGHSWRDRRPGGQLDPRRLDPKPTRAAAQAGRVARAA